MYIRGCGFENLGEIDQAIEDFTRVLQYDKNHVNAAFARGACWNKQGNFLKAIEDYNMALDLDQEKQCINSTTKKSRRIKNYLGLEKDGTVSR